MAGNTHSGRIGMGIKEEPAKREEKFTKKMPENFPVAAKGYWKSVVPILKERGTIKNADYYSFHRLCILYHLWNECETVLVNKGITYSTKTDRGCGERSLRRPEADLAMRYNSEMSKLERKFGLNPTDRALIKTAQAQKKSVRNKY